MKTAGHMPPKNSDMPRGICPDAHDALSYALTMPRYAPRKPPNGLRDAPAPSLKRGMGHRH